LEAKIIRYQRGEMDRPFAQPGFPRQHPGSRTRAAAIAICLAIHGAILFGLLVTYAPKAHIRGFANTETMVSLVAGRAPAAPASAQRVRQPHFVAPKTPANNHAPLIETRPESSGQTVAPPADEAFQIGGATDTASQASDFRDMLLRHISTFRRYPSAGLSARLSGTVHVAFTINRSGALLAVWLQQTSGSDVLDTEAIETIRRAQPFPAIPSDLPDPLTAMLPVSFVSPP
jgi:TonB family protein